jgi:RNA polymerase sigma-70 factor (ECF subfamily)
VSSEAIAKLFRRHNAAVLRRASAILGDRDTAKDVMQEVFLRAMRAPQDFLDTASPAAWLYRVTTNLCLNRLRDFARRRRILSASSPVEQPQHGAPVDVVLTVRTLLSNVPADLREIGIFYFIDHMSQEEIAEILRLPRRTVAYRLEQFRTRILAVAPREELAS